MPLTPAKPPSFGAWKEQLIPASNKVAATFKRCHYLNDDEDELFGDSDSGEDNYSTRHDIIIHCHVHERRFSINCGDGQQTIKWLSLCAAKRYGEELPKGRVRRRETFNTDNISINKNYHRGHKLPSLRNRNKIRPRDMGKKLSIINRRQKVTLGGTHKIGVFLPMQLEKAKRRKRRTAVSQKSSAGHHHQEKLSNMNIMWRATSLESKAKGDLRRHGVHKDQQSNNGDHHEVFRNSTNLLGHVMHDHQTHVSTNTNTILKTLKVKHLLLGRVKQRKEQEEKEIEKNMLQAQFAIEKEGRRIELLEAQSKKQHWPSIGLVPKAKLIQGLDDGNNDSKKNNGNNNKIIYGRGHHQGKMKRQSAIEPNEERICEVLDNGSHIRLHLDDAGGSYITRENEFAVDAFMKARLIPAYKKEIISFQRDVYVPDEKDKPAQFLWVKKRGIADGDFKHQTNQNWKKTKIFRFVKDHDEHEKLQRLFQAPESYNLIRTLFRQYAYSGEGDAFTMSMSEFISCIQDSGLIDRKHLDLSRLSTIFVAADFQVGKMSIKEKTQQGNPDNALTLHEFLEALCRVAVVRFGEGSTRSAHDCTKILLTQYILPHAAKTVEEWQLLDDIENPQVQLVYKHNIEALKHVFSDGCPIKHNKLEKLYMVMDDFMVLIEAKGLLSGTHNVSRMTVKEAYVWSQRRTTSTHAKVEHEEKSLRRMDFYEFLEALALLAVRMHSDPFQHGKMPLHEKLEILIDHLLGRGPSEEEMKLKNEAMKLGFDSGTTVDIWWEKKQRSYKAVVLGVDGEKLRIVVQYFIDESIAFYTLDDLFDKVVEAKQRADE